MEIEDVMKKLQAPLPESEIQFKAQAYSSDGSMGLFVPYVDARAIIERLNEATGGDWEDHYEIREARIRGYGDNTKGYMAVCTLIVADTAHQDVGEGEYPKDAVSDALKRAAVKFGIGLELYRGQKIWAPVDEKGQPKISREEMLAIWKGEKEAVKPLTNTGPKKAGGGVPATEKQVRYIHQLLKKYGMKDEDTREDFIKWAVGKIGGESLTKQVAGELLDTITKESEAKELIELYVAEHPDILF